METGKASNIGEESGRWQTVVNEGVQGTTTKGKGVRVLEGQNARGNARAGGGAALRTGWKRPRSDVRGGNSGERP